MSLTKRPPRLAAEPAESAPRNRHLAVLVGALLAVGVLIAELRHLPLPYPSDQVNYFESARDFPHPGEHVPIHQSLRLGLILPIRLAMATLGYSEAAYFAVPVLTGVALALAVYVLGAMLFSKAVGVAAAAITVGNNVIFYDLLQPLPDALATALFTWAVAVTVAIRQGRPLVSATARRRAVALLGLGVLLGWSYLTREYIIFAWPIIALLLVGRTSWRGLLLVAAPLAVIGLAEMALAAAAYGDPLTRLRATSEHGSGPAPEQIAISFQDKPRTWYLTRFTHGLSLTPEGWWLQAALVGTVVGGLVARRSLGVLLAWAAAVYVPLVLLGGLIYPAHPMLRLFKLRYFFPLMPALILGGVAAVWLLTRAVAARLPRLRDRAGLLAGAAVLLLAIWPLALARSGWDDTDGYRVVGSTQLDQFRDWLADNASQVPAIWADERTARLLPIYAHQPFGESVWDGRVTALTAAEQPRPGEFVVLFSAASPELCWHCAHAAEAVLGEPIQAPATWREAFATADKQLLVYRVG
jgi:hypothetical protein